MKPIRQAKTQSSLLIPEKFLDVFEEKTKKYPKDVYFHFLLKKYKGLLLDGILQKSDKIKTDYQAPGQNLIKVNIRPFNPDWIELGILSNYLGISRTGLFTWFLTLEFGDFDEILCEKFYECGVPPTYSTILQKNLQSRKRDVTWKRKIYYKIRR